MLLLILLLLSFIFDETKILFLKLKLIDNNIFVYHYYS